MGAIRISSTVLVGIALASSLLRNPSVGNETEETEAPALKNGDVNGDHERDLSDVVYILSYLFADGPAPVHITCKNTVEAIQNGDLNGDASIDIGDGIYLLFWLFLGHSEPVPACAGILLSGPGILPLSFRAEFQHGDPTLATFSTVLTGVLDLRFTRDPTGTAQATFEVTRSGCFLTAWWQVESATDPSNPWISSPAEICIAAGQIEEAEFNAWMEGTTSLEASLVLPLVPLGTGTESWVNTGEVVARLFLRGCGNSTYQRLAELRAGAESLAFQPTSGGRGQREVSLQGANVILENIGSQVWSDVRMGCGGGEAGLPTAPPPGLCQTLNGTTRQFQTNPSPPLVKIGEMGDTLNSLFPTPALPKEQVDSLRRTLARSVGELQGGDAGGAILELDRFYADTTELRNQGLLSAEVADSLLARCSEARNEILHLATAPALPPPSPDLYCDPGDRLPCEEEFCAYTTYHVDQDDASRRGCGLGIPEGSENCAFRTISEAMERAEAEDLCGVNIVVAGGDYDGDIILSRHTRIHGSTDVVTQIRGSISNDGPYELLVENVAIISRDGIAVSVDHPCASTTVHGVLISNAQGSGILQRGGALEVRNSTVRLTTSRPDILTEGIGIFLTCGVQAVLENVILSRNTSSGLCVIGEGTRVAATDLFVSRNGVHPAVAEDPSSPPNVFGAVQVRNGARLETRFFRIVENDLAGLLVAGEGAVAVFQNGRISETQGLLKDDRRYGGNNIMVLDAGALELTDFHSSEADLCGIQLARGGVADLHGECALYAFDEEIGELDCVAGSSEVSYNAIGANIQTVDFDLRRLQDRVLYHDNERTLDATALPVPEPGHW